jgi:hypothetical protein
MSVGNPRTACAAMLLLPKDQRLSGSQVYRQAASSSLSDGFTVVGGAVGIGLVGALRQNGPLHGNGDGRSFEVKEPSTEPCSSASLFVSLAIRSPATFDWTGCASQSPHVAKARTPDTFCSRTQLSSRTSALAHER